jgi:hypothetical protein
MKHEKEAPDPEPNDHTEHVVPCSPSPNTIERLVDDLEEILEELVDLEDCVRRGQKPPRAKQYRIRINGQKYTVSVPGMTGRELLNLADKTPPEKFMVAEKIHGQKPRRIALDEYADFTKPGIEKFLTQPLGQTEGQNAS